MKFKFKIIIFIIFTLLISCTSDNYYRESFYNIKKLKSNNHNSHPEYDSFPEPDLPDENENNRTLLGIDSDKNGIRDDIDVYINNIGQNYKERTVLRIYAQSLQIYLKKNSKLDEKNRCEINKTLEPAKLCLRAVFAPTYNTNHIDIDSMLADSLLKITANTRERQNFIKQSLYVNELPSDCPFHIAYAYCEFTPQNLIDGDMQ
jgi:hypothetical protein